MYMYNSNVHAHLILSHMVFRGRRVRLEWLTRLRPVGLGGRTGNAVERRRIFATPDVRERPEYGHGRPSHTTTRFSHPSSEDGSSTAQLRQNVNVESFLTPQVEHTTSDAAEMGDTDGAGSGGGELARGSLRPPDAPSSAELSWLKRRTR